MYRGLDSSTCFQCISLMKSLAQEGRTIICVIHQPSSSVFEMFDSLYLLAKGQCIYQGPTDDVIQRISNSIDIDCPEYHSAVTITKINNFFCVIKHLFFFHNSQADFGKLIRLSNL